MRRNRVLIEFTEDTFNSEGELVRSAGDRLLVDQMSAKSFVEVKKVAIVVTEGNALVVDQAEAEPVAAEVTAEPVADEKPAAKATRPKKDTVADADQGGDPAPAGAD